MWISGRWEIQWNANEPWVNLGIIQTPELEWQMIVSICALGAQRAGLEFYYVDTACNEPGSLRFSIHVLDRGLCDCGTCAESGSCWISTRTAITTAVADYEYRAITDDRNYQSVASSRRRPNSIVKNSRA